jgi:hypothetical protein
MTLKIWWIPQIPMEPFFQEVPDLVTAKILLETLDRYDLFQLANNVRPDFSNAGGLMVLEDGEWVDWENEDGESIDALSMEELKEGLFS